MARLRGRDCQDLPPQHGLFEPSRNRAFQNARTVGTEASTGDDQDTAKSRIARGMNKCEECTMRLGLRHAVQVETRLDPVEAALQPLGVGAVDPGEAIKSRGRYRHIRSLLLDLDRRRR